MPIGNAINDIVETGFAQTHPRAVVEYSVVNILCRSRCGECEDYTKWQPKQDDKEEGSKITSGYRQVGFKN
jgi:hypothetical protein